jgi:hypothetical protein
MVRSTVLAIAAVGIHGVIAFSPVAISQVLVV